MEYLLKLPILTLFSISLEPDWSIVVTISAWLAAPVAIGATIYVSFLWFNGRSSWNEFEIDQAEIGVGSGKVRLKPNMTDRQVAYSVWVELSTRKIGLPIDFEHDVIAEVYDSWHTFFSVTRELIKLVPVNKVRQESTQKIIALSIEVLNEGLRPHLTRWQARFRRWYEHELTIVDDGVIVDPQKIQQKFPKWNELKEDMEKVNQFLIKYREKMRSLVMNN